ncbi:TonB-dependent receptor plug domain-containing protein [Flavobacterium algicola]|uniref:TonB-dependent receptor plug domain-containing protein n=1 Tax=Flavobacterium algicola TaxID=556529 RepID=UPI001EFDADD2|nr:TonB-dependent receptor [Flavobacterium algicola]MCG9792552.1 TonB-dependent receptor [Flavobacterium algicola]
MNNKIVRVSTLCVLLSASVFAQQRKGIMATPNELSEVVISDSKFDLPKEKSGKVIVKITAEDLAKKSGQSIATVLSAVAGVEVNGNQSSTGKNLSYYIRGSRSRQTLILIDGIPVSDASGINFEYDLRLIPVEQVESIEIMKGASSTLYGSGAAAGIINITLKKGNTKAISGSAYLNVGTQNTAVDRNYAPAEINEGFSLGAKGDKVNYFATLNASGAQGISEAAGIDFEDDKFSRVNSLIKVGLTPTKKLSFDFFANFDRMKNDFDYGAFADDLENYNTSNQYRVGFSPKYKYNNGELVINTSGNLITRELFVFGGITNYKSRNTNVDAFNKYKITNEFSLLTGVQYQFFEMSIYSEYTAISNTLAKFNVIDPYLNLVYTSDFGFNINAGARLNNHSDYGNHVVYNINPSYNVPGLPLKILASYSTAYITPSLYQLFDTYSGNLDLKPEENTTIEAGFEVQSANNKVSLNVVGFYREEDSAIEYYSNPTTYASSYFNASGKYNAKGVETAITFAISNKLNLNANYTFSQVESKAVNNTFPDVTANLYNAKHKINASLDYQFSDGTYFGLTYQYLDKRDAFTGYPPVVSVLDAYQLLNAVARYNLVKDRLIVFGTVSNITNEDFVEVLGYSTKGRNFKIGMTFLF